MQIRTIFLALTLSPVLIGATEHKHASASADNATSIETISATSIVHGQEASHAAVNFHGTDEKDHEERVHNSTSTTHVIAEATKYHSSHAEETHTNRFNISHAEATEYHHGHGKGYKSSNHTTSSHANSVLLGSTFTKALVSVSMTSAAPSVFTLTVESKMTEKMTTKTITTEIVLAQTVTETTMSKTMMMSETMTMTSQAKMTETATPLSQYTTLTGSVPTRAFTIQTTTQAMQSSWMTTLPATAGFVTVVGTGGMVVSTTKAVFTGGAGRAGVGMGIGAGAESWIVGLLVGFLAWI